MITIEDKIESFKKIINEDINESYEKEIEKITSETQKLLEEKKDKTSKEMEKLKRDYEYKFEIKKEKINSKSLKEGQDIILNENNKIYKEFFKSLKEKIKDDYKGKLGEIYIKRVLDLVKNEVKEDDIIYVSFDCYERDKEIIQNVLKNVDVIKSENIKLGGFEIVDKDKTYRLNYCVDFMLSDRYNEILTKLRKELNF